MKLLNLFKKKKEVKKEVTNLMTYTINNKIYAIADSQPIKIQAIADDVSVYGWTLEIRYKMNGEWCSWFTYWNNRIYNSRGSALEAATKVYPSYQEGYEFRISPLYKMNELQFRDYKIDQLLSTNTTKKPNVCEIKAWKIKDDCEVNYKQTNRSDKFKKGTMFIQMEDGRICNIKNQIEPIGNSYKYQLFNSLIPSGLVEEVDIKNEKWAHPHLCKELKIKWLKHNHEK